MKLKYAKFTLREEIDFTKYLPVGNIELQASDEEQNSNPPRKDTLIKPFGLCCECSQRKKTALW